MGLLPDAQHVHMIAIPSNRDGLRLLLSVKRIVAILEESISARVGVDICGRGGSRLV